MFDLTGRVALVTGGNGGIGLGMAKGLAEAGAKLVLTGRDSAKGAAAAAQIGHGAVFVAADITDPDAAQRLVEATESQWGRLDILVNNAGMSVRKQPETLTLDEWRSVLDTNLTSAFVCCQAVYPAMQRAGGGKIINIGSMLSLFGAPFAAAYAASKGGIVQLSKSLATAWAKDGIQVNAVLPGWIETALTDQAREQVDGLYERMLARIPARRWGQPGDLSGIAVFLASDASAYVTGAAIPVDGGFSVQG
jgi:2-dehydro-3-deoxy-D-gluconate 5-dehydrogenase